MTDTGIPSELIAAQQHFDQAHAALMSAPDDLADDERRELRQAELQAALALQELRARIGGQWPTMAGQKALWAAVRGEAQG